MTYDCFISYASADLKYAEELYGRLRSEGFNVWLDKARLHPGFDWHQEIEAASENSRVLLPVLTLRWKQSEWTRYETYGAEAVIPLLFEGAWAEVATPPLMAFQHFRINLQTDNNTAWPILLTSIRELLAQPPLEKNRHMTFVPFRANPCFVGREAQLNVLHEKLHVSPGTKLTQGRIQVIAALGGIGKTALAREYVEKFWRCYRQIFWVDCRRDLVAEYARIDELIFPSTPCDRLTDLQRAERARFELRQSAGRPSRLLILDDAPDEAAIQGWLPTTGNCHTIITSRFTVWSPAMGTLPVGILAKEAARFFLCQRTGRSMRGLSNQERQACDELVESLGSLPLALEQAGAYISRQGSGFGFQDYLRLYQECAKEMIDTSAPGTTEYPASLYTTWCATTRRLSAGAQTILRLTAFLAPAPIPVPLVLQAKGILATRTQRMEPPSSVAPKPPDEFQARAWKDELVNYSMAKPEESDSFSVHQMVRAVEWHRIDASDRPGWIEDAMRAVTLYAPTPSDSYDNWGQWRIVLPHVQSLWDLTSKDSRVQPIPALLTELAAFLNATGRWAEAEGPARRDVLLREQSTRPDDASVFTSIDILASSLRGKGCWGEAEKLYRRALEGHRRLLGPEDQHTLASLNNLAGLLAQQGNYAEAEALYRQALEACERTLGPRHSDTVNSMINLAYVVDRCGRHPEAGTLYRRALAVCEQTGGSTHRDTVVCLNGLAAVRESEGNLAEAESLYRSALEQARQCLGFEHPITLTCLNNLAAVLISQSRLAQAEPVCQEVTEVRERVLGPHHPDTLASLSTFGRFRETRREYGEAEKLYRRALDGYELRLGKDHPDTLVCLNDLAGVIDLQNRSPEAEHIYLGTLEAAERRLGLEHPLTLTLIHNLGVLYQRRRDLTRAELRLRRALEGRERVLGSEHPEALQTARSLLLALLEAGRCEEAGQISTHKLKLLLQRSQQEGQPHPSLCSFVRLHCRLMEAMGRTPVEARAALNEIADGYGISFGAAPPTQPPTG